MITVAKEINLAQLGRELKAALGLATTPPLRLSGYDLRSRTLTDRQLQDAIELHTAKPEPLPQPAPLTRIEELAAKVVADTATPLEEREFLKLQAQRFVRPR